MNATTAAPPAASDARPEADPHRECAGTKNKEVVPPLLVWLVIAGALPLPIYAGGGGFGVGRFLAIGIFGIGTSLLVGALVGFLFAVPKRLQDITRAPETAYVANTNLEQISDWLTKILVGVSLTQVPGIVNGIQSAGSFLAEGAGVTASRPFFSALTLYYLLAGFFIAYLWTSLQFRSRLEEAEESLGKAIAAEVAQSPETKAAVKEAAKEALADDLEPVIEDALSEKDRRDLLARSMVNRQLEPPKGGTRPTLTDLREAISNGSDSARYEIFEKARTYRRQADEEADTAKRRSRGEAIVPIFEALIEVDTERRYHRNHAQLAFALKLVEEWERAEHHLTKAIQMRDQHGESGYPLYELNRAECRIMLAREFEARVGGAEAAQVAILGDIRGAIARSPEIHQRLIAGDAANKTVLDWLTAQGLDPATIS